MVKPQVTGYLYPWDVLGDPSATSWIKGTGVHRVAMAAAYHSVRAATPRHPARRVVDAGSAALYLPVTQAWDGSALRPGDAAGWTGRDDSFAEAAEVVRGAGLPVDAWVVLTHSSAVGSRNQDLCVRNAFAETYRYALCPSQPDVRDYAARLVEQVLDLGRPDGLVLEASGPLGFGHQNQHEKTEGAGYSPWVQALLSLCFCGACRVAYTARGLDAEALQARVRDAVHRQADSPKTTPATAPEAAEFLPLLETRWDATAALLDACLRATAGSVARISLHASPDPWSTGPFVSVEALRRSRLWAQLDKVSTVVPCWGEAADSAATVAAMTAAAPGATVGSYVLVLPPKPADAEALAHEWDALLDAGSSELHVYHLGLASTGRLDAAARGIRFL
ncbi:hypothetical protein LN996_06910 [Arthrobacter sp. AK01]|uniref:hypothetical protein n=1 Tax=Micrococcaceae TaxID=1268 RepID=UPI001E4DAD2D|nr:MULTISPECIES: hypothetical protein [Micrococcaceae]MCD4850537.1 hypothetical protein [Arthrobacter sp. AK01]MCP1411836.1 hypothetical protein [Paenarthrobacter sp. A20]